MADTSEIWPVFESHVADDDTSNFHCVIEKLLKIPFSSLSFAEKLKIIDDGRPRQVLHITNSSRRFSNKIYENNHWICGCKVTNRLYCWCCLLFSRKKCVWNDTGYNDLKNIYRIIKWHKDSAIHIKCEKELVMFGRNQINHFSFKEGDGISIERHNEIVRQNREIIAYLISVTCLLGKLGLPFTGHGEPSVNKSNFMEMLNEFSRRDSVLKSRLDNSSLIRGNFGSVQSDLIVSVAQVMTHKIKTEVSEASFVALIFYEGYDADMKPHMATIMRYVKKDGVTHERFINFTRVNSDRSANALLQHTVKVLNDFNCGTKLVAHTYDGATVKTDEHNELQAEIRKHVKGTLFVHCYAHELSLVLSQAVSCCIKQVKIFFSNVAGFSSFFLNSPKRTCILDSNIMRSPSSPAERWNFPSRIVETINENKVYLESVFESVVVNEDGEWDHQTVVSARGLSSVLMDFEFNFLLMLFALVFRHADTLFKKLQKNQVNAVYCNKQIKDFQDYIAYIRNDFEDIWERTDETCERMDKMEAESLSHEEFDKTAYERLFNEILDVIALTIDNRFCENYKLRFMCLVDPAEFPEFAHSFPEESLSSLKDTYEAYFDLNRLKNELNVIYNDHDMRMKNVTDLYRYIKSLKLCTVFTEATKLIELVLTIPADSVTVLESFSCLKRIKNYLRTKQDDENLSSLGLMNIEYALLENLQSIPQFQEEVIDRFARKRKLDLEFRRCKNICLETYIQQIYQATLSHITMTLDKRETRYISERFN